MSAGLPAAVERKPGAPTAAEDQPGVPAAVEGQAGCSAKRSQEDAIVPFAAAAKSGRMLDPSEMSSAVGSSEPVGRDLAPGFRPSELQNFLCAYAQSVMRMKPVDPDPTAYTKIIRGRPVQVIPLFVLSTMHPRVECLCGFSEGGRARSRTEQVLCTFRGRALCRSLFRGHMGNMPSPVPVLSDIPPAPS